MVEIRLKTVEYAQFNFRHRFWPNFFQFGRDSTHDSAKMVEIRLKTVEYAQFNFRHRFWLNFFQFGRNSTHDWFFVRRFGLNSASLEKFRPIWRWFRQNRWRKFNCAHSTIRPKTKLLCG
jgi:hypothetical protein